MTSISRQIRVPYAPEQLYTLVNDVQHYPEFVPWCVATTVRHQDKSSMQASLTIEWQGIRHTVETKNKCIENQSISMELVTGSLLKTLHGRWTFIQKGDQTEVTLSVEVDFGNKILALVFSKVAQSALNRVVDAFRTRANTLYGSV